MMRRTIKTLIARRIHFYSPSGRFYFEFDIEEASFAHPVVIIDFANVATAIGVVVRDISEYSAPIDFQGRLSDLTISGAGTHSDYDD